jgi:hypothetical protein
MKTKITKEELTVVEMMHNPIACAEIMFHDFDNLGNFSPTEFGEIRKYQYPMLAYDIMLCEDKTKSKKENFNLRKGLAESYNLGGRLTGKTRISIIVDSLISIFNKGFKWAAICSLDAIHIRGVFEPIISGLENHKILKNLKADTLRSPSYQIRASNGCLLESVNLNIASKNPGGQFFGKHVDKLWQEESSFMTKEVSHKQLMAQSEMGCINRYSGMTTFSKMSPMGEIFDDLKNRNKIVNFPSHANPTWDETKEEDAIKEFGGKNSVGYLVQILGKVVEGGDTTYDMDRIRSTYIYDKKDNPVTIKSFEINKENYLRFKEMIVVERPNNADQCIVALDKGEGSAPTEIIILFKINKKFRYEYNITLFKLKPDEDEAVVDWLIEKVKANLVGIDQTSGTGKVLFINLSKKYPENIIGVSFNENIEIGIEKDEKGKTKYDASGHAEVKKANMVDWSVQCLKDIFYNDKIECLVDYKLDQQFAGVVSITSKQGKILYGYKAENHIYQAFQVFSILNFLTEYKNIKPIRRKKLCSGVYN